MLANSKGLSIGLIALSRPSFGLMRVMSGAARFVALWLETRRQLRALADLDDHLLRDVGLSRTDIERACPKSFWTH
jgi:uncharacterized protein YjiS (DUF1127 family)